MGLRRHLPDEQLDLYLRQRVPRGAHRPRTRARAGLLQLRGAPGRQEGRPAGREDGGHPHPRGVAEPPARQEGRHSHQQARRDSHATGQRRVHLPQPPRLPGWGRVRLSHRGAPTRRQPDDPQARGLLAAPAPTGGPGRRRRGARHLRHPPVGPAPLGQGRPGVPLVVHRGARRLRRVEARLRGDAGGAHQDGGSEGLRTVRGVGEGTRAPACRGRGTPPSRGARSWGGCRCRCSGKWRADGVGDRVRGGTTFLPTRPATCSSRPVAQLFRRGAGSPAGRG